MCIVRRVVRFTFRLVVLVGVLALFAGVLAKSLHAQTVFVQTVPFLRHGEWNAIGLNNGSEIRVLFSPEETGVLYAQVTVTRFLGLGPSTTMNFQGLFYPNDKSGIAKLTSEQHGMPGADVVCGTLSSMGYTCFIFEMGFDGYIPGSGDSKLYTTVLRVKITVDNEPVFDGVMTNPIPLRVDSDGTVVW